jgi:hypothetical protein
MFPHVFVCVTEKSLQARNQRLQTGVSRDNHEVPQQPTNFRPLERRSADRPRPLVIGPFQKRLKVGPQQTRSGLKRSILRHGRSPIPWADILANVAAEQVMSDTFSRMFGNCAAQFNGRV